MAEHGNLLAWVPPGIPLVIQGWAHKIRLQLVTDTCDCADRCGCHFMAPQRSAELCGTCPRPEQRCCYRHFLCRDNLDQALSKGEKHSKKACRDAVEYVERAVVENVALPIPIQKTFVDTMLANVFQTPRGGRLVVTSFHGKPVVTETDRERWTMHAVDSLTYDGNGYSGG